jgi:dihydrofolate reductase
VLHLLGLPSGQPVAIPFHLVDVEAVRREHPNINAPVTPRWRYRVAPRILISVRCLFAHHQALDRCIFGTGGLVNEVTTLKHTTNARIICFGGAGLASALVAHRLVDEYQLFVNPTAVGAGLSIFASAVNGLPLQPIDAKAYDCGIVVNWFRAS